MRIIIKNLPENFTENALRESFEKYGIITDIYLAKRVDESFKGVAFIGYKNEDMAKRAILIRNNTYVENKKIIVEKDKSNKIDLRKDKEIETNFIKIINLSEKITEEDLRNFFSKLGKICSVKLESKIAIIEFQNKQSVITAVNENRQLFGCRTITYPYYQSKKQNYFNSLFFDFKNILRKIEEKEKIEKNLLVNIKSENLATKVALLETHLIHETKAFLESNNIFLDNILSGKNKRGLIVRNYDLIGDIFKIKCDMRIAPSKTLALLFFKTERDCKIILNKFNKMRIKNQQIFCEYIPNTSGIMTEHKFTDKLVVKNIPFQANAHELKKLFESQVKIKNIRLPMKNSNQHRGFCFLSFFNEKDARTIFEYFGKNTHLYGRRLIIEISS